MDDGTKKNILDYCTYIRRMSAKMAISAGRSGCHIGGSFSCIEIFSVLYGAILNYDISNPEWIERDRFIPSKTHCILSNFSALAKAGFLNEEDLFSFDKDGGMLAGHPWNIHAGLEFSGGSLGMGLSVGIGFALAAHWRKLNYKTYVLLGDGESNEGAVWEAMMSASQFKLDNLVAIIDYNNMQFDGRGDDIMSLAPLKGKAEAFGWKTVEVNGHSIDELFDAFNTPHAGKPLMIIAKTIKAHGVPSLENKAESHHALMTKDDYNFIMEHLETER